jgi:multimeric flavodoxin WrbA
VTVETASLAKLRVEDCRHCNFCWRKQTAGRYCVLDDDAQPLFEKAEAADVLVLASPVYVMRTSARMAAFIDRLRLFIFGSLTRNRLRNKVGVSLVVGWMRHAGVETTHLSHLLSFGILEMVPAICHESISPLGGSALSSENGWGRFDAAVRRGSQNDEHGLESARLSLERGIELATIIKRGTVAGAAPGIGGAAG